MEEFHELFPRVRFYVEQSDSRLVNENLMNQRGELGFTGYKGNSGLCFEPVFYDEMVLITPDTDVYRIYQNGEAIPVELFINEPFIMREDGSGTRQEMEKALVYGKPVFKNVDVIARMSNPAAIKHVVSRGLAFPSCPSRSSSGRRSRIISAISASAPGEKTLFLSGPQQRGLLISHCGAFPGIRPGKGIQGAS